MLGVFDVPILSTPAGGSIEQPVDVWRLRHSDCSGAAQRHTGWVVKGPVLRRLAVVGCRRELLHDYKANRVKPAPGFAEDLSNLKLLLQQLRMPTLSVPGYEADDVSAGPACCTALARGGGALEAGLCQARALQLWLPQCILINALP